MIRYSCLIFWVLVQYLKFCLIFMCLCSVSGALYCLLGLCIVCWGFVKSFGASPPPGPSAGGPGPLGGRPPPPPPPLPQAPRRAARNLGRDPGQWGMDPDQWGGTRASGTRASEYGTAYVLKYYIIFISIQIYIWIFIWMSIFMLIPRCNLQTNTKADIHIHSRLLVTNNNNIHRIFDNMNRKHNHNH